MVSIGSCDFWTFYCVFWLQQHNVDTNSNNTLLSLFDWIYWSCWPFLLQSLQPALSLQVCFSLTLLSSVTQVVFLLFRALTDAPCLSVSGQADSSSVVVAGYNVTAPAGSRVVLQCVSGRMVWTRDRVRDRQRVVHWDMYRAHPDYAMERVVDMFSAGDQRIYNSYNLGRVTITPTAFRDGNFSLVIKGNNRCLSLSCLSCFLSWITTFIKYTWSPAQSINVINRVKNTNIVSKINCIYRNNFAILIICLIYS